MKARIVVGIKLFLVAAVSGYLLFLINSVTKPVIDENKEIRERAKYSLIFPAMDSYEKTKIGEGVMDSVIVIKDADGIVIGSIYSAGANNDYGSIAVLIGIDKDSNIKGVEYATLNQTPSYASKVNNDEFVGRFIGNSTDTSYADFDVKVGATYSATTTRDLVDQISKYHEGVE